MQRQIASHARPEPGPRRLPRSPRCRLSAVGSKPQYRDKHALSTTCEHRPHSEQQSRLCELLAHSNKGWSCVCRAFECILCLRPEAQSRPPSTTTSTSTKHTPFATLQMSRPAPARATAAVSPGCWWAAAESRWLQSLVLRLRLWQQALLLLPAETGGATACGWHSGLTTGWVEGACAPQQIVWMVCGASAKQAKVRPNCAGSVHTWGFLQLLYAPVAGGTARSCCRVLPELLQHRTAAPGP